MWEEEAGSEWDGVCGKGGLLGGDRVLKSVLFEHM